MKTTLKNLQYFLGLKEATGLSQAEKITRSELKFADSLGIYGEGLHVGKHMELCIPGKEGGGVDCTQEH